MSLEDAAKRIRSLIGTYAGVGLFRNSRERMPTMSNLSGLVLLCVASSVEEQRSYRHGIFSNIFGRRAIEGRRALAFPLVASRLRIYNGSVRSAKPSTLDMMTESLMKEHVERDMTGASSIVSHAAVLGCRGSNTTIASTVEEFHLKLCQHSARQWTLPRIAHALTHPSPHLRDIVITEMLQFRADLMSISEMLSEMANNYMDKQQRRSRIEHVRWSTLSEVDDRADCIVETSGFAITHWYELVALLRSVGQLGVRPVGCTLHRARYIIGTQKTNTIGPRSA